MLCPICKKTTNPEFKPFCSIKCKQIDLLNWLNENYKVPSAIAIDDNELDNSEFIDEDSTYTPPNKH
ncbi:DNA gyrase inhibitor YacG [Rickettsiales bacterium LUAb2]